MGAILISYTFMQNLFKKVFASVCPPQPDGQSLFMLFTHSIKVDIFLKMESQTWISSKAFCIENMISSTQQMIFVSYKGIWVKWDNFHNYYFFSQLYWTPSMNRVFLPEMKPKCLHVFYVKMPHFQGPCTGGLSAFYKYFIAFLVFH